MIIYADNLRQIAVDIQWCATAGDFGRADSRLCARMEAYALAIWRNAEVLEAQIKVPARVHVNFFRRMTKAMWRRGIAG
jgi:hypothetical protein